MHDASRSLRYVVFSSLTTEDMDIAVPTFIPTNQQEQLDARQKRKSWIDFAQYVYLLFKSRKHHRICEVQSTALTPIYSSSSRNKLGCVVM